MTSTASILTEEFSSTIDGQKIATADRFSVLNPATGEELGTAPSISGEQLDQAFDSAARAFTTWRLDVDARRAALRRAADLVDREAERLAPLLTAEQGKPLADALGELSNSAAWFRYFAELDIPHEIIRTPGSGTAEVRRIPLGVVAAITPWNYPVVLAVWKLAPALLAGNTVVLKPSPFTPLTTLALGEMLQEVFPPGVVNVVSGADPLGAVMTAHPVPRKISFTGSIATGKRVMNSASEDLKRVTLELGGNDPAVVLPGSDVSKIAEDLFWSAFRNNGQICMAIKRIYAHESIHSELVEALGEVARTAPVGLGTDPGVRLGPINNRPQFDRVSELVEDARSRGARVVTGGRAVPGGGFFYEPTILDQIPEDARVVAEEQFGPALPVLSYRNLDDALGLANNTNFGLTASVWGEDPDDAVRVAERLDAGRVTVNSHGTAAVPYLPFGGHRWSGVGVENGPWGLEAYTATQVILAP